MASSEPLVTTICPAGTPRSAASAPRSSPAVGSGYRCRATSASALPSSFASAPRTASPRAKGLSLASSLTRGSAAAGGAA